MELHCTYSIRVYSAAGNGLYRREGNDNRLNCTPSLDLLRDPMLSMSRKLCEDNGPPRNIESLKSRGPAVLSHLPEGE
jgi:hypothetical protein